MLKLDCKHCPKKGQKREFLSQEVGRKNASPSKASRCKIGWGSNPQSNPHPAGWASCPQIQLSGLRLKMPSFLEASFLYTNPLPSFGPRAFALETPDSIWCRGHCWSSWLESFVPVQPSQIQPPAPAKSSPAFCRAWGRCSLVRILRCSSLPMNFSASIAHFFGLVNSGWNCILIQNNSVWAEQTIKQ